MQNVGMCTWERIFLTACGFATDWKNHWPKSVFLRQESHSESFNGKKNIGWKNHSFLTIIGYQVECQPLIVANLKALVTTDASKVNWSTKTDLQGIRRAQFRGLNSRCNEAMTQISEAMYGGSVCDGGCTCITVARGMSSVPYIGLKVCSS